MVADDDGLVARPLLVSFSDLTAYAKCTSRASINVAAVRCVRLSPASIRSCTASWFR